jgi:hypothetical protein
MNAPRNTALAITDDALPIFNTNDACREGQRIEPRFWRAGDGERPHYAECARLDAEEDAARQTG